MNVAQTKFTVIQTHAFTLIYVITLKVYVGRDVHSPPYSPPKGSDQVNGNVTMSETKLDAS